MIQPVSSVNRFLSWIGWVPLVGILLVPGTGACLAASTSVHDRVFQQFESEIYPLMTRFGEDSCVACHDDEDTSDLVFVGQPRDDLQMLLERQYLSSDGPDTILARLTTSNEKKRMPKGKSMKPWSAEEITAFKSFLQSARSLVQETEMDDESFPSALLNPYLGKDPEALDNQFISYSQLKGKIQSIFGDDWVRDGRDLFQENVAFFNGADFVTRFNESHQASSSFLTGMDMLGRDVVARAYRKRRGPFRQHPVQFPELEHVEEAPAAYRHAITGLYQSILYRSPSPDEMHQALRLVKSIQSADARIAERDYALGFKLTVHDPASGMNAARSLEVPVDADPLGLYQEWLNQREGKAWDKGEKHLWSSVLQGRFQFTQDRPGQRIVVHRLQPGESVSLAAVRLRSLDGEQESVIGVKHASVARDGAWKVVNRHGFESVEHESVAVGQGVIEVPVEVRQDGAFEVTLLWRRSASLSERVLVEVYASSPSVLAMPPTPEVPPAGQAWFSYDSSEDARPFAALPAQFRFDADGYVEVNNKGTDQRVTAGAMRFLPTRGGEEVEVDSREAEGQADWKAFKSGTFRAYNRQGTQVEDENKHKGERFLRYRPSTKREQWNADSYYDVHIHYPGKRDHETHVPVIVQAVQSSPIVQLVHPVRAKAGETFTVDASATYNIQRSALQFHWEQTRGVPVRFDQLGPVLKVHTSPMAGEEAAWIALARALLRHPDFLFIRPPSMQQTRDASERERLQLVNIALDLLGRPPSASEFRQLEDGVELPELVDSYLDSEAFRKDYYRRIRLYLESQGTSLQDEPARLWSYFAFNDRPFQEILTADYTVDPQFRRQERPAYHGRTGVLTTKGFIDGKPGLPHYNYAAQVSMLFLGYVYELPPEINEAREGITALGTTDPNSMCYSCHKILTPLAFQRSHWTDQGAFRDKEKDGTPIRADDRGWVEAYPFKGPGMEAFATQAVKKERFVRTIINTHFNFYFGRSMRYLSDERALYKRLWDNVHAHDFQIRALIRAILCSPEYLGQASQPKHLESTASHSQALSVPGGFAGIQTHPHPTRLSER